LKKNLTTESEKQVVYLAKRAGLSVVPEYEPTKEEALSTSGKRLTKIPTRNLSAREYIEVGRGVE